MVTEDDTLIHAIGNGYYSNSLCNAAFKLEKGRNGVLLEDRHMITCPKCLDEVARRMDGTPVSQLQITTRVANCFDLEQIYTVECIESMSDGELLRIPNFGKVSLQEIREEIRQFRGQKITHFRCYTCPMTSGCYQECMRADDFRQIAELSERCRKIEYENTILRDELKRLHLELSGKNNQVP